MALTYQDHSNRRQHPMRHVAAAPGAAWLVAMILGLCGLSSTTVAQAPPAAAAAPDDDQLSPEEQKEREAALLTNTRQLTFAGRRAGEGYFSRDGKRMVFQSEREPGNPFFQIYVMDLETGDLQHVSPGHGKTTCAWIHPSGQRVLYASTHEDPAAKEKQQEEIQLRESGNERRYTWDYDEHYDIYEQPLSDDGAPVNLTNTRGYDAEGSWSPDGQWIAFASNRAAYSRELSETQREEFERDPSVMMDIYIMRADGTDVRQLTDVYGYDGGPFFSPDGQRICWRRFTPNGAIAEVWTMNIDGTDQRQLTRLGAMSWAPYYHPSGDYLIFTTNRHGFANFELYLIDVEGKSEPARVTYTDGFDGLPVFTPDGAKIAWTTNRTANKQSQIFVADWNDAHARQLLGLGDERPSASTAARGGRPAASASASATGPAAQDAQEQAAREAAVAAARESAQQTASEFRPEDVLRHVDYLCRPQLEGRMTGTAGERAATAYVAAYFDSLGLEPAGDDGSWFQEFSFTSGVALGDDNRLAWGDATAQVKQDWQPLAFSATGPVEASEVVFAGYGIVAPDEDGHPEYDSYVHLDVENKWVIVFRYMPEDISAERRQHLSRFTSLRFKTMTARDKGARGLIVVSGPNAKVKHQLVPLQFDGSLSGASVPVISVTDALVDRWLASAGKSDLKSLQTKLDTGELAMGFALGDLKLKAQIDVESITQTGRNVLGVLRAAVEPASQQVIVGAHIDHLGRGNAASSLARDDESGEIHFGADDNASGVAAMLEIAQYLSGLKSAGQLDARRDIVFAGWSGEELGLLGSSHFIKQRLEELGEPAEGAASPHTDSAHPAPGLYPSIAACLNLDMVGRLRDQLILQGVGSSTAWRREIEQRNAPLGLPLTLQNDSYIPTDASAFFMRGVPILSAFTGAHSEYHTPRDTPDLLNYDGAAQTAKLMALIARSLARAEQPPEYVAQARDEQPRRAHLRAFLGTIPDYAESDVKGVALSGVQQNGPAQKAGIRSGDIIVELAGKKIENIYDYTYAIEALKVGEEVSIVVQRGSERVTLKVTPGSRD